VTSGGAFPLHTEAGKHYLLTAQNQPFLLQGDAPWSLIVQLTNAQVDQYLEDRRQKGFNTVLVNLLEHQFADQAPKNVYGDAPFLTPGDFSTPNEAYFAHAEYVIAKAAEKGMLVLLTPAYMGYQGGSEGWYQEMGNNGVAKLRAWGQYVATRFATYDNIVWVHGGDYTPPEKNLLRAVANGIRDVDTAGRWPQTFHGGRGTAALNFLSTGTDPWLSINTIYTDAQTVVSGAFGQYNLSAMPFFLVEAGYENNDVDRQGVRGQAWQTMLSGGSGHVMGNWPVWYFGSGWQSALNSGGASTLGYLRTLLEARAWWTLVPDQGATLLTSAPGSGSNRAVAALASDGSYALVYTPGPKTLAINMARLVGPQVQARWFDPSAGTYSNISGSPFAASGTRSFTAPATNAGGDYDSVLVLESVP
jgi:hypothetical protein